MPDWFLFKLVLDSFGFAFDPMFAEVLKLRIQKLIFGPRLRTSLFYGQLSCFPRSLAPVPQSNK